MERLVLFARRPRLGRVKTRLVPPLDAAEALGLYVACLSDSIHLLRRLETGERQIELCFDGPPERQSDSVDERAVPRVSEQGPGDLGARLLRAFERSHGDGCRATAILGSDAPTLPPDRARDAFVSLRDGRDLVLVPALDGGYVLIGLRVPVPGLFDAMPWGGPEVARRTLERARTLGLSVAELPPWHDVDDLDGLRRLALDLADPRAAASAPASARALAALGPRLDRALGSVV